MAEEKRSLVYAENSHFPHLTQTGRYPPMPSSCYIPVATALGLNSREHYMARKRRVANERYVTASVLRTSKLDLPPLPLVVTLTRIAPGTLDDDNLPGSLKAIRDEIAAFLGVNDRLREVVRYEYSQRRGAKGERGVIAEFMPMT